MWYSERTDCNNVRFPLCYSKPALTTLDRYSQLDLVCPILLGVVLLGLGCSRLAREAASELGHNGGSHVARGVDGTGELRRHEVGLVEVDGSMDPVDMLHVGQPDILSGLASPDSEAN